MSQSFKTARPVITLAKIKRPANCLPVPSLTISGGKGGLGRKAAEVSNQCEPTDANPIRQHHKLAGA